MHNMQAKQQVAEHMPAYVAYQRTHSATQGAPAVETMPVIRIDPGSMSHLHSCQQVVLDRLSLKHILHVSKIT
jgi:hypothetical protein